MICQNLGVPWHPQERHPCTMSHKDYDFEGRKVRLVSYKKSRSPEIGYTLLSAVFKTTRKFSTKIDNLFFVLELRFTYLIHTTMAKYQKINRVIRCI